MGHSGLTRFEGSETSADGTGCSERCRDHVSRSCSFDGGSEDAALCLCVGLNAGRKTEVMVVGDVGQVEFDVRCLQEAQVFEAIADRDIHFNVTRNVLVVHECRILLGNVLQAVSAKDITVVIVEVEANLVFGGLRSKFSSGMQVVA